MTTRILDTETTGTDPDKDRVVQIASIDLTRDGGFYNPLAKLVDPCIPVPPEASAVHHIIDADVRGRPQLADVIGEFSGADLYVSHNARFDQGFVAVALGNPPWVCTYKIALRAWPDAPSHSNQALRYWRGHLAPFGVTRDSVKPHDAVSDVLVTGALFLDLARSVTVADMLKWSVEPALISICRFGSKHRGKAMSEIAREDPSYLKWVVNKSEMDSDTKWSAQYWLEKR